VPPPSTPAPYTSAPAAATPADRIRVAWQRRHETDYIFSFWTALGWTILTCGIYSFYVIYQLVRRDRDHNLRRLELLDAATAFAWDEVNQRGLADQMRPAFERIGLQMNTMRQMATEFREPIVWTLLTIIANTIVHVIAYILMDGDLVRHDYAEGAIEAELSAIYASLGIAVTPPDPARVKQRHNYVGRIIASLATCGLYTLWWQYDVMVDWNRHFEHNWRWEDDLAGGVQSLIRAV
jgi:hypothetical protein